MRKVLAIGLVLCLMLFSVPVVLAEPWVYPVSEASPTTTEYWVQVLGPGTTTLHLVLWNHNNNYYFINGKFVIAIKSGLSQVNIDSVKIGGTTLPLDTEDITVPYSTPGLPFPPGGIFPCPWKQYAVSDLEYWQSPDGWQGSSDNSGVQIDIQITVTGSPQTVTLYFLAWGYDYRDGSMQSSDTPYSHITQTVPPVYQVIPEVPLGAIMAGASMLAAFGAFVGLRRRKNP